MALTAKQQCFVEEYLKDLNATLTIHINNSLAERSDT